MSEAEVLTIPERQTKLKEGLSPDISNQDYHNPLKYHALSSSGVKQLLRSPAHYKHSINPDKPKTSNDNLLFGEAAHSLILEPEKAKENVVLIPEINRRTNAGKTEWAELNEENRGKILIDKTTSDKIGAMNDVLKNNKTAMSIFEKGQAELSGFWKHDIFDFWCKLRIDFLVDDFNLIVDYKTSADASLEAFSKAVFNYGYHIQSHWYKKGYKALTGNDYDFVFIVQEKEPPYAVAVYTLSQDHIAMGMEQSDRACVIYNECLRNNEWSETYPDQIQTLKVPGWARS